MSDNNFKRFSGGIQIGPGLTANPLTGEIGEIYHNTSTNSLKVCTNTSPLTWSDLYIQSGTIDNATLVWDTATLAWKENTSLLINQNLIETQTSLTPLKIQIKPGQNSSPTGDGVDLELSGGISNDEQGQVIISGRSLGMTGTSQSSDPTNSIEADIYYDSVNKQFKYYDGTSWKFMSIDTGTTTNAAIKWDGSKWTEESSILIGTSNIYTTENSINDSSNASNITLTGGHKTAGDGHGGNVLIQGGSNLASFGSITTLSGGNSTSGTGGKAKVVGGTSATNDGGDVLIQGGENTDTLKEQGRVRLEGRNITLSAVQDSEPLLIGEEREPGLIYFSEAGKRFRFFDGDQTKNINEGIIVVKTIDDTTAVLPTAVTSSLTVSSISMATGTVTAITTAVHGLIIGDKVNISGSLVDLWLPGTTYSQYDVIREEFGDLWEAKVTSTPGSLPSTTPGEWKLYKGPVFDGDHIVTTINSTTSFDYEVEDGPTPDPIQISGNSGNITHFSIIIDGIEVTTGDLVLYTNLSSGNNKVYRVKATGGVVTWTAIGLNVAEDGTPKSGDFVFVQYGTSNKEQLYIYSEDKVAWEVFSSGSGIGTKSTFLDPISTALPTGSTVTIDNVTGVDGDTVLYTNLTANNNRIYELGGVGSSITWTALEAFSSELDPTDGDSVRVAKGDAFNEQLAVFDGADFKVNDTVRYFDGVSGDFWEVSSIKTTTLADNTTGNIFSVNVTGSENMVVSYSIIRGANKETGDLYITSDGTNVSIAVGGAYINDTGITFSAVINTGNVELNYTSTSTGSSGTIKYAVKRWSDISGGPTGIPSYSGATGSSTTAAGNPQEVQFNTAGLLDANSNFKWDTSENGFNLNGLISTALSGSITINNNQTTPLSIINYSNTAYKHLVLSYSVEKESEVRTGRMLISNDSTTKTGFSDDFVETNPVGVTFTVTNGTGTVDIKYTSTLGAGTGTFKYSLTKWL